MRIAQVLPKAAKSLKDGTQWHRVHAMTNVAQLPERSSKPVNELVGTNVRWIAELRGVSQKELALLIGVTQGSMSRRMSGATDWAPDEMQKVADRLNVPIARLFSALPHLDSNQEPAG
jgi:hypothetical protein